MQLIIIKIYRLSINGFNLIGKSNQRQITDIERYAPLRCLGNQNILDDYYKIDNCSICLEKFDERYLHRVLTCKHAFHTKCIDDWLIDNVCCPICRTSIEPIIIE
jgi:hypothetical protein